MKRREKETNIPRKNATKRKSTTSQPIMKEITNNKQNTNAHKK